MTTNFAYVYMHGFLGRVVGPGNLAIQRELRLQGKHLELLNVTGGKPYKDCTVSTGINQLDQFYQKEKKPLRVVAKSMGGFMAAVYTSQHPERVDRLVLINPAFNLEKNWMTVLEGLLPNIPSNESMRKWQEEGNLIFSNPSSNEETVVRYEYVKDSLQYPSFPLVQVPTQVYYGKLDSMIPPETHHVWKNNQQNSKLVELIELDDDHRLDLESSIATFSQGIDEFFK